MLNIHGVYLKVSYFFSAIVLARPLLKQHRKFHKPYFTLTTADNLHCYIFLIVQNLNNNKNVLKFSNLLYFYLFLLLEIFIWNLKYNYILHFVANYFVQCLHWSINWIIFFNWPMHRTCDDNVWFAVLTF